MKKTLILFMVACLLLCLIPSVGMIFFPTTETSENKAMAPAPKLLTEEGGFNQKVFSDFETWFTERMALRNRMVYTDAVIQTSLFQESNVSGVIYGTDGWMYYTSTLSDYQGTDVMSERELFNLSHNFSVIQEYLDERDIPFVLTIAPNKNTLYGENMPYYKDFVVNPDHNAQLLAPELQKQGVTYMDLFEIFREQEEILYLRQDSHWNMKGACLAYNHLMDTLELPHETYDNVDPKILANRDGDLNRMLYSFYGPMEEDYDYGLPGNWSYVGNADSVEDGWIVTENPRGTGTLLMFRDSFANTLIPFFSEQFQTAYYSKGEPNGMEKFVETYQPDCVVIQKVERNIANYLNNPPILTPPETELPDRRILAETQSAVQLENTMFDANYYAISGTVDPERMEAESAVAVSVDGKVYRAYHTGENGYVLYLKKDLFGEDSAKVRVYIVNEDHCVQAVAAELTLPQS